MRDQVQNLNYKHTVTGGLHLEADAVADCCQPSVLTPDQSIQRTKSSRDGYPYHIESDLSFLCLLVEFTVTMRLSTFQTLTVVTVTCLNSLLGLTWAWVGQGQGQLGGLSNRSKVGVRNQRGDLVVVKAGGFGAGGKEKPKKLVKLKPKAQWDRFLAMKGANRVRVAVRTTNTDADDSEWLEVGHVKSVDDAHTALAVARQRALIAEHAKRLFPLQVSIKDTVQWAYWTEDDWVTVDKAILDKQNVPDDLEKIIGFEGRPDPSSGFYCVYNEGRLVSDGEDARPSSRKLK